MLIQIDAGRHHALVHVDFVMILLWSAPDLCHYVLRQARLQSDAGHADQLCCPRNCAAAFGGSGTLC